jgi:hypothetical protein
MPGDFLMEELYSFVGEGWEQGKEARITDKQAA